MGTRKVQEITRFGLEVDEPLAGRYQVVSKLGSGWEGEVYLIRETATGIERAAKLFFPQRNPKNRTAKHYAIKLHELRHCNILIKYLNQEIIRIDNKPVTLLVSEFVEGDVLSEMIKRSPGKRLSSFEALHLLYALARGMSDVHLAREYHGDLHTDNIIVRRYGLGFEVKLIDLFSHPMPKSELMKDDVCDLIRVFYDALGGAKHYSRVSPEIKQICCGLKRTLILKKYRNAAQLRDYLEKIEWQ